MSKPVFEDAVREWLDDGSDRTPPAAIDAVLLAVRTTPQEWVFRLPRRLAVTTLPMRLAAALAIAVLAGATALNYLNRSTGPGTAPTPTPTDTSPSPSTPVVDTSRWIAYTSERYGFDIKRPPDWVEHPANHTWRLPDDADVAATGGAEQFEYEVEGQGIIASAWSVSVEPGTTLETWLQAYCPLNTEPCTGIPDRTFPASIAGRAGSLVVFTNDVQAFALVNDRIYVVAEWRPDGDPSVSRYGGGRQLLEAFVSTMSLRPPGPAPAAPPPALTKSFTSDFHGYSIAYPEGWAAVAATRVFLPPNVGDESWADTWEATPVNAFRAASTVLPVGVTADDWIDQNLTPTNRVECWPARATLGEIVIDGQPGKIRTSCDEVEATVIVDGRVYLFTLFPSPGEPYAVGGGRALFEAMVGSVRLLPKTAQNPPSPGPS